MTKLDIFACSYFNLTQSLDEINRNVCIKEDPILLPDIIDADAVENIQKCVKKLEFIKSEIEIKNVNKISKKVFIILANYFCHKYLTSDESDFDYKNICDHCGNKQFMI